MPNDAANRADVCRVRLSGHLGALPVEAELTWRCGALVGLDLHARGARIDGSVPSRRLIQCPEDAGPSAALRSDLAQALFQPEQLGRAGRERLLALIQPQGSPFAHRVWQALARIPPGRCCSYATLARLAGRPNAVRAVASACARNPIAVLLPCHRVVHADGKPGAYRWGDQLKRALLEREGVLTPGCARVEHTKLLGD
ncbi:MAG: methylated-DNA--[protein]-cysteine S-methyltransferase [Halothiobacillaceae bacterium]